MKKTFCDICEVEIKQPFHLDKVEVLFHPKKNPHETLAIKVDINPIGPISDDICTGCWIEAFKHIIIP